MEETVHELPDRRAIEGVMRGLLGGLVGSREETPLSQAQDLMYEAFESHDPKERVELARKALELSPDCADAYVLLAEQTKSRKEALELFEKGVAAGERALGPEAFQDDVGHFWGLLETRPYMRAREGLASPSGRWGGGTKRSVTSRTCCGSIPTTTRECDTPWPGGCSPRDGTRNWPGS